MRLPTPTPADYSSLVQHEVEVNGTRIAYTEAGEGPPILLLHGAVFAGNVFWWGTQQALAPQARTIAPDFPGWGASGKPPAAYALETYRAFISGFLDALGLEKVAIVGHSMGGILGSAFTLLHPERVNSLMTLAVPPAWADFDLPPLFQPFLVPLLGEVMMAVTPWLGTDNPLGIRRFYESLFHDATRIPAERMKSMLAMCCEATSEAAHRMAFLNTMRATRTQLVPEVRQQFRELLAKLDLPVMLVAGAQDPLFPLHLVEGALAHYPRARFEVLSECGHFPTWEQAPRVESLIREFSLAS